MNIDELIKSMSASIDLNSPQDDAELYRAVLEKANGNVELVARSAVKELSKQIAIQTALANLLQRYEDALSRVEYMANPRTRKRGRPRKLVSIKYGVGMPQPIGVAESLRITRKENKRLGVKRGRTSSLGWILTRDTHAKVAIGLGTGGNAKELAAQELERMGVKPDSEDYDKMLSGLQKTISDIKRK